MWLITKYGFFSIIKDDFKPIRRPYQIRASVKTDLENLLTMTANNFKIRRDKDSGYFTIFTNKLELYRLVEFLLSSIDYSNYKAAIDKVEDQKGKLNLYRRIIALISDYL